GRTVHAGPVRPVAQRGRNEAKRRVAITGLGLVTPVGNDVATTWDSLLTGRSGGAPITLFDASGFPVRIAAEVKNFSDEAIPVPRRILKLANRAHRFALTAAEQAFVDAGIRPTDETATRWACAVGAHRMRVGRAGARHGAQVDPPRRRGLRAGRRLRLDDQPGRYFRLLSSLRTVARQRYARTREPSVRPHAQRLSAGRGRGLR